MEHINGILKNIEHTINVVGADNATRFGFTQVPNFLLKTPNLSGGAKLTYAMLLHYAWANNYCFPGQDRLAADMGAGKRSVIRFLQELEVAGFIAVNRRGQGKSNVYDLFLQPTKKPGKKATKHGRT